MADEEKNDDFSFDNDPGKLTDKDDVDFTFSDIPVLGVEKEKKDTFSFDQLPEGEDASIASFEAMLKESPDGEDLDEYDDATRTEIEVERAKLERKAKKKKKLMIKLAIAGAGFLVLCLIGGQSGFLLTKPIRKPPKKPKNYLLQKNVLWKSRRKKKNSRKWLMMVISSLKAVTQSKLWSCTQKYWKQIQAMLRL